MLGARAFGVDSAAVGGFLSAPFADLEFAEIQQQKETAYCDGKSEGDQRIHGLPILTPLADPSASRC
jgi:hypothetical protein